MRRYTFAVENVSNHFLFSKLDFQLFPKKETLALALNRNRGEAD